MKNCTHPNSFSQNAVKNFIFAFLLLGCCPSQGSAGEYPFKVGETIVYDIKKFAKVGEATLTFKGSAKIESQDSILIVFTSKAMNFFDEEKIYLNPKTFYPITVERDLNIWGKKEKIREIYNHTEGTVSVLKQVQGKEEKKVIKKKGPIDNLYGFIYRYRWQGTFKVGESLQIHLPTKDVKVKILAEKQLDLSGKKYQTVYMESAPKQYSLWFDKAGTRVPVRIDGAMGLGKTVMTLRQYQP